MKRFYAKFDKWEDYQNGMYETIITDKENKIKLAVKLLSNSDMFLEVLRKVIIEWPIATRCNLTNTSSNRQAWTGQAACCYKYSVPEILTRQAWKQLTYDQMIRANKIADICIAEYEDILRNGREDVIITEYQMKLPLD